MTTLALVWLILIAFIIIMYIILDGFTLGVGLLFFWVKDSKERDTLLTTVLPVWDGNETWLVFAGAALYAGFPSAFAVLMSALYLPLMLLITGLLLRGVAFEFTHKATKSVPIWEMCFLIGSLLVVTAQGIIVGAYVQGFVVDPHSGDLVVAQLFNWFNLFCAIALLIGYTLLGSARLIKKTSGDLQNRLFKISFILQWFLLIAVLFVGFYSPINLKNNYMMWFNLSGSPFILMFTIVIIILMGLHALAIKKQIEDLPFMLLVGVFIMAYIAFIISNLPYIVPQQITFMQAKADDGALLLMLYGVAVLLPLLLFYTAYAYHIFGGKVNEHEKINY